MKSVTVQRHGCEHNASDELHQRDEQSLRSAQEFCCVLIFFIFLFFCPGMTELFLL